MEKETSHDNLYDGSDKIFVLAGYYHIFWQWIKYHNYDPKKFVYINDIHKLRGVKIKHVIFLPGYQNICRHELDTIMYLLDRHMPKQRFINDIFQDGIE